MHASVLDVLIKMVVALVVVVGGIGLLSRYAQKRGIPGLTANIPGRANPRRAARRQEMTVLARQQLGKGIAVVAIRAGETVMLIGVTPTSVTPITELDPLTFETFPDDLSALQEPAESAEESNWEPSRTVRAVAPRSAADSTAAPTWMSKLDQLRELTTRRS